MNLPEKNYKEIIIEKLRNEKFNRKLKKTIYPILYSEKESNISILVISPPSMRSHYYLRKTYLLTSICQFLFRLTQLKEKSVF